MINTAATDDSSPKESLEEWVDVAEELLNGNRSLPAFALAKYINRECLFAFVLIIFYMLFILFSIHNRNYHPVMVEEIFQNCICGSNAYGLSECSSAEISLGFLVRLGSSSTLHTFYGRGKQA